MNADSASSRKPGRDIAQRLLQWYASHGRDLPWRRQHTAYAIWVSEIMLQQTRVETVREYYQRFMKRFPDIGSLARARADTVLKFWEGLGYYSRARNLHATAKIIYRDHDGLFPESIETLRTLPGIGEYTAGAIASIAFGQDAPVLDANVRRVLSRLFLIDTPPGEARTLQALRDRASEILPAGKAGDFNEALMDLGATVCLPRNPRCDACPLAERCKARNTGRQEELPLKTRRSALPHHTIVAGVIFRNGKILVDRRPAGGLLGGLWEFPGGKVESGETLPEALRREIREEVGLSVRVGRKLAVVKHAYSHFRITLHAYRCTVRNGQAKAIQCDAVRWLRPGALRKLAFPKANQAILDILDPPDSDR